MNKSLKFKVEVKELEDKISREIEISKENTLADLVYATLTSFGCYAKEFYVIDYNGTRYDSMKTFYDNDRYKSAITIKLKDLNFKNKTMILDYNPPKKTNL